MKKKSHKNIKSADFDITFVAVCVYACKLHRNISILSSSPKKKKDLILKFLSKCNNQLKQKKKFRKTKKRESLIGIEVKTNANCMIR